VPRRFIAPADSFFDDRPLLRAQASACANIGVLCAFIWVEWSLLSSRLIVIAAEHAKIRLSHMIQALQKKLAPWFRAAKEPVVQIAASVGVLLSGVVGSVGLLITGLVGIVDRMLDIVGLGGMRRRLMRVLGLDRILGGLGVDKVLAGLGLGDLLGETAPPPDQGKKTAGGSIKRGFPIVGDLGLWNDTREAPAGERRTGGEPSGGLPVVGDLGLGRTTAATAAPEDDSKLRKRGGQGGGGGTSGLPLVGGVLEGGSGLPLVGGVLGGGGSPTPEDVKANERDGWAGGLPVVGGLLGGNVL
jgi:hypothetical protein